MTTSLHPTESYIDESVNDQNIKLLNLAVQLSHREVSFCITDKNDKCYAIENYSFTEIFSVNELNLFIGELLNKNKLLQPEFLQIVFSYKNSYATLIPAVFFNADNLKAYLSLVEENPDDLVQTYDFISKLDAYNVYIFPQLLQNTILQKFKNAKFIHFSTVFIKSVFINYPETVGNKAYVNVNNNEFDICIFKESKLQLYNTFQFKTKEDFIYYLLFAIKQFDCDPAQLEVILSGKITEDSVLYQLIVKYISEVSFGISKITEDAKTIMKDIPGYYYYSLLNMSQCVS
ncbi:MAG: DUF3822 family protein [Bacteroidetes bacterium]|nr:DUF3822 family protein [Bacteroidota bacterium]